MGARGPLPKPDDQRARRNIPTIPTTNLPASGREGASPEPPAWIDLGPAGSAWWEWAWHTPQAAAWHDGYMPMIAHRASLEDDLRIQSNVDVVDFFDALNLKDDEDAAFKRLIGRLCAMATDRIKLLKETRELDNILGLSPKGMAALHWKVVADKPTAVAPIKHLEPAEVRVAPE